MRTVKRPIDAARRIRVPFAAAITLIAALGVAGVAGVFAEARAATQSECTSAFRSSSASSSCELESVRASGDNCTFVGLCQSGSSWISNSITVPLDDADDLQNCSGVLATSC